MNIAWLLGSYVVTPQMALILLPFYVLIPTISLPIIYLAEIMNALIIVLWFSSSLNLGNPLAPTSPVQWFAAGRQIVWLVLFIKTIYPVQTRNLFRSLTKNLGESVSQNVAAPQVSTSFSHSTQSNKNQRTMLTKPVGKLRSLVELTRGFIDIHRSRPSKKVTLFV